MAKQPAKGRNRPKEPQETLDQATNAVESVDGPVTVYDVIPPEVHAKPPVSASAPATDAPAEAEVAAPQETAPSQSEAASSASGPAVPPARPARSGGFLALTLGGFLAGALGFAVATLTSPAADNDLSVQLAQQAAEIDRLAQRVAQPVDLDLSAITRMQEAQAAALADLDAAVTDLALRIEALESRPAVVAGADPAADAAVAADIDALRSQLAEMTTAAQTELEAARAAAASIEESAAAAARSAAARAALARVQTALESGAPLGAALGDLEAAIGQAAPAELIAVQDGVPTLPVLQAQFPDVARAALATARSEGVAGEETSGLGAFLRNQFDVRSTAPREGADADAVLSRAEAALRAGRLSDALAEIAALPEVARAEMSAWLALAEGRAAAVAAVDVLSSTLSDN